MKTILAAAALFVAVGATATENPMGQESAAPGVFAGSEANLQGKVLNVNRVAKTITMKDAEGDKIQIKVPAEVQDLDLIQKGALLNVQYTRASAIAIGSPGERPAVETEDLRNAPGQSGEAAVPTRHITGKIKDIDRDERVMMIEGPDKQELKLQVPAGTPGFDKAEEGETAAVHYSEAVAKTLQTQSPKE